MPKATALPSWEGVRHILRSLGWPAIPGWLLLAFSLGKEAHFVMSLLDGIGLAGVLREYGWVIGLVWLGALVLWEARKPPRDTELRQVREMERLRTATVDVLHRFEELCVAYEQTPVSAVSVSGRRHELLLSASSCLEIALSVLPPKQQRGLIFALHRAIGDYAQYHDRDQRSAASRDLPATLAIDSALDRLRAAAKPSAPPPAAPPSSTASA